MHHLNRSPKAIKRARRFRRNRNLTEDRLGQALRDDRLGVRFRSQYSVDGAVLDFYCAKLRLCLEVDGEVHRFRTAADVDRDEKLAGLGIETLRISSFDVWEDLPELLTRIACKCIERAEHLQKHDIAARLREQLG